MTFDLDSYMLDRVRRFLSDITSIYAYVSGLDCGFESLVQVIIDAATATIKTTVTMMLTGIRLINIAITTEAHSTVMDPIDSRRAMRCRDWI